MRTIRFLALALLSVGCVSTRSEPEGLVTQVISIRNVGADDLAAELVKLERIRGGDAVAIAIDPRTNSLILSCTAGYSDELTLLRRRIASLDDSSRSFWTSMGSICGKPIFTQVVFLRSASASEIAARFSGFRPVVWVSIDERTNSLSVSAMSHEDLGEALLEIGRQDQEPAPR